MKKLMLLSFLAPAVHAGPDVQFIQKPEAQTVTITWITAGDITKHCESVGLPYRYDGWLGCATVSVDGKSCVIYTNKHTSHEILGHEIRHCFQGNFHP
jgi:hypothetical protein